MNEASNWQVFAIGLVFLIVVYSIARMAKARREERIARAAPTATEPAHIEHAKRLLADAQAKHLDFKTSGDHALVLAAMYENRVAYLKDYLGHDRAAPVAFIRNAGSKEMS